MEVEEEHEQEEGAGEEGEGKQKGRDPQRHKKYNEKLSSKPAEEFMEVFGPAMCQWCTNKGLKCLYSLTGKSVKCHACVLRRKDCVKVKGGASKNIKEANKYLNAAKARKEAEGMELWVEVPSREEAREAREARKQQEVAEWIVQKVQEGMGEGLGGVKEQIIQLAKEVQEMKESQVSILEGQKEIKGMLQKMVGSSAQD